MEMFTASETIVHQEVINYVFKFGFYLLICLFNFVHFHLRVATKIANLIGSAVWGVDDEIMVRENICELFSNILIRFFFFQASGYENPTYKYFEASVA